MNSNKCNSALSLLGLNPGQDKPDDWHADMERFSNEMRAIQRSMSAGDLLLSKTNRDNRRKLILLCN